MLLLHACIYLDLGSNMAIVHILCKREIPTTIGRARWRCKGLRIGWDGEDFLFPRSFHSVFLVHITCSWWYIYEWSFPSAVSIKRTLFCGLGAWWRAATMVATAAPFFIQSVRKHYVTEIWERSALQDDEHAVCSSELSPLLYFSLPFFYLLQDPRNRTDDVDERTQGDCAGAYGY